MKCCSCQNVFIRIGLGLLAVALILKKFFVIANFVSGLCLGAAVILIVIGSFGNTKCSL